MQTLQDTRIGEKILFGAEYLITDEAGKRGGGRLEEPTKMGKAGGAEEKTPAKSFEPAKI